MMTTEYEYLISQEAETMSNDDDWKKYDTQDHEAEAAYYDQLAQEQAATPQPRDSQHLTLARSFMDQYDHRINQDSFRGDIESRTRYEDTAFKQSMMHAAIASAEAATRQAEVAESMLEFVADFVGGTNLVDALLQWGYRQRAG